MASRPLLLAALLVAFATGCSDPYQDTRKIDTIEAWEAFLKENPSSSYAAAAEGRLEELMFEAAEKSGKVADWDAYFARFPKGLKFKDAQEGRLGALYHTAETDDTVEAWTAFNEGCAAVKSCDATWKRWGPKRLKIAENRSSFELGATDMKQVNLAEDPEGPLDGWGFFVPVTNKGNVAIERMVLRIRYFDAEGAELARKDWPVVAKALPGNIPFEDGFDKPIAPGETRTWEWTSGDMPAGWSKQIKVEAVDLTYVGETKAGKEAKEGKEE